ncbi:hypothetical protein VUR80DRAFT_2059 [Thermomyces stellatus]
MVFSLGSVGDSDSLKRVGTRLGLGDRIHHMTSPWRACLPQHRAPVLPRPRTTTRSPPAPKQAPSSLPCSAIQIQQSRSSHRMRSGSGARPDTAIESSPARSTLARAQPRSKFSIRGRSSRTSSSTKRHVFYPFSFSKHLSTYSLASPHLRPGVSYKKGQPTPFYRVLPQLRPACTWHENALCPLDTPMPGPVSAMRPSISTFLQASSPPTRRPYSRLSLANR